MVQNLQSLFERAFDEEPVPPPGDPAQLAMAQGRRIRRRRGLLAGGAATAVIIAAVVAVNAALPPARPTTTIALGAAIMAPADPRCTWPAKDRASDVSIFLVGDTTATQRSDLQASLGADPLVRDLRFESQEAAYVRFSKLWQDSPDFVASVTPEAMPASFRVKLVEPSVYLEFAARYRDLPSVEDVVGAACPGPGR